VDEYDTLFADTCQPPRDVVPLTIQQLELTAANSLAQVIDLGSR
jgi:hypothetical protein